MPEPAPIKPVPDAQTRADQTRAADPGASAWVSANAGSGKTWVLATRVIRILLDGTDPSKILCLTYTRAAAAEMKSRVFERLGEWVTMADEELRRQIADIDGSTPDGAHLAFARTLFARALETPGGLKIQTIHAFCEALLHRFPLEANIAGHFELIDAEAQALLVAQARRTLLSQSGAGRSEVTNAGQAVVRVLALTGEAGLEKLLDEIVAKRLDVTSLLRRLGAAEDRRTTYRMAFGFDTSANPDSLIDTAWPLPGFSDVDLAQLEAAANAGKSPRKTHLKLIAAIRAAAVTTTPGDRFEAIADGFLKKDGTPATNNLFPADIVSAIPNFEDRYMAVARMIAELRDRVHLLTEIDNTLDVLSIADHLIARYEDLKRRRGFLDFEDLIARTANMLLRQDAALWVRYKLDQGIDHILIDEAQDTAPAQWDVIRTLAGEFFAGDGARDMDRTVFAVGDEKQSIYSFQGADPSRFAESRDVFAQAAEAAERPFSAVRLQASFRSTQAILDAVDRVFADEDARTGLTRDGTEVRHRSLRKGAPGRVDIWETVSKEKAEQPDDWTTPADATTEPAIIVAERVAHQIADWIGNGTVNAATGKPITAGDIVVLVRSRDGFVNALSRALKDRRIPVAGADRLTLTDHIAVLDLMALGRVMLNTADDLSLAALLKSPLFGFDEEALFALAHDRGASTLWSRLAESEANRDRAAHARLEQWAGLVQRVPVHDFYAHVLAEGGARAKLMGRLGPETGDVLDEFAALTLATERTGPPSLQTFLNTLEVHAPQIKREMDQTRGEVRIMTVHGAKGLEAPIVFLIDRGNAPFHANRAPGLLPVTMPQPGEPDLDALLWRGTPDIKSQVHDQAMQRLQQAAREEYRRLLYVGMTRAADRLVVAGYRSARPPNEPTWHDMVTTALADHADRHETPEGIVLAFPAGAPADTQVQAVAKEHRADAPTLPPGLSAKAPPEPPPTRPLIPSGASGFAIAAEAGGSPKSLLTGPATTGTPMGPALRGTVMHTLLQMLPDVAQPDRQAMAARYCERTAPGLSAQTRQLMLDQAFAILDDQRFAALFGPDSQAEVPVMGTVVIGGEDRAVSGVIDRLAVIGNTVWLIDYKTDRTPPDSAESISEAHLRQMALYRALIAPLYPNQTVRATLLFTATPKIIELPAPRLDTALAALAQA